MSFKEVVLQPIYDDVFSTQDVVNDFLTPVLKKAKRYDRVAGYFSSKVLASAARGVAGLVNNGGQMRLITSHSLTSTDAETLHDFYNSVAFSDRMIHEFHRSYEELSDLGLTIAQNHVRAMCWMLKQNILQIKIIVPTSRDTDSSSFEKFHPKYGLFYDSENEVVAFTGSVNETESAWQRNIENLDVYVSWDIDESIRRIQPRIDNFERLWDGRVPPGWKTIDLPNAVKEKLILGYSPEEFPSEIESGNKYYHPYLRNYQEDALVAWESAGRKGIFEMATGTGKTKTAKACIDSAANLGSLLTLVIAPYQHIADQWISELSEYNLISTASNWKKSINRARTDLVFGNSKHLVVVAVQNTAAQKMFREEIISLSSEVDNFLLVGDEVHWLGAPAYQDALIAEANFRLGLSATPQRHFDEIGTGVLLDYFGGTIYELSLSKALTLKNETGLPILTPYVYHPLIVSLSENEQQEYKIISQQIARILNDPEKNKDKEALQRLYDKRADISKNAESKIPKVRELLNSLPKDLQHCLIYCANLKQLEEVAVILQELKIDAQKITGEESTKPESKWGGISQREYFLKNFAEGKISVLVAIRCLDEGVDIPNARIGIILASSGNPKEFIQRRGRLMRVANGKEKAIIYDFCVLPEDIKDPISSLNLVQVEVRRILEYASDAINKHEVISDLESLQLV